MAETKEKSNYTVLARKYRPLSFKDLVGQAHVAKTIEKAIETKRIAHGFLLSGTRGIGKTTTARLLAMALNCESDKSAEPCGKCTSCTEIQAGINFDVLEIDGASNNGVENARDIIDQINYTVPQNKYRIIIIDEVHMLTTAAFNALLKTLEEPPPRFIFIFATTEAQKVPQTILSRVQRYDFRRITLSEISVRLQEICANEDIKFEIPAIDQIATKADGSMRDALTLLDQVIPYCDGTITALKVREILGLVDTDTFFNIFTAIEEKNYNKIISIIDIVFNSGFDIRELCSGLIQHCRNILTSSIDKMTPESVALPVEHFNKYKEQGIRFNKTDLLRIMEILSKLSISINYSRIPKIDVEAALFKISMLDSSLNIEALLNGESPSLDNKISNSSNLETVKKKLNSVPNNTNVNNITQTRNIAKPLASNRDTITENTQKKSTKNRGILDSTDKKPLEEAPLEWDSVISSFGLGNDTLTIFTYLANTRLEINNSKIKIIFPSKNKFHCEQIKFSNNNEVIKKFLLGRYNYNKTLECITDIEKPKPIKQTPNNLTPNNIVAKVKEIPSNINDIIDKEPIIGKVLDIFDGSIE